MGCFDDTQGDKSAQYACAARVCIAAIHPVNPRPGEAKEQLGGYYMVECADLDEAIVVAAKLPGAREGSIEVRPIWEM